MSNEYIRIYDTTLRDGEQTPGVTLITKDKVTIARQLDRLGVDVIEAGFPIVSKGEQEAIKAISNDNLRAEIAGLARAEKSDIDAILACNLNYVHLFIATSDIHLKYKLKIDREEALRKAVEAVEYARAHGLRVEFSAEDATRSEREFLRYFYKNVVDAGAERIDIPDTVGYATPEYIYQLVSELRSTINVPISIHCHNDFGLAVANSIAAIKGGSDCAHVTINGIGERAGNTSLEEFVMSLHCLYNKQTRIKTELLYETSKLVSRLTGVIIQPNKAIIGENAFAHESGIHTHGVLSNPLTYEPINPEMVGRKRLLEAGKHAGSHGIRAMLEEYGLKPSREELKKILNKVKELADKGKRVTDADLLAISSEIMHKNIVEEKLKLNDFVVTTGIHVVPTASVRLVFDNKEIIAAETGVGPVDAALKAIQKITNEMVSIKLKEFRLEAITGGTDALAEVSIRVEDKFGNIASARAAGEDIIVVSVQAMINGINKIMQKREILKDIKDYTI